ncbi:unnamed protein product [Closterium sp. Naga37s-1]|nr:unnamed protein product [Closterium sp. Naga37s-1]
MAADRWSGGDPGGGEDAWGRGEAESEGVWERVVYQADDRGALERLMKRKGAAGGRNVAGPKPLIGEPQAAVAALGESAANSRDVSGVKFGWPGLVAPDAAGIGGGDTWQRAKWGLRWFDSPTADDWEDGFPDDHVDAHGAALAGDALEGEEAREAVQGAVQKGGGEGEVGQGQYSRRVAEGLLERLSFMPALHADPPLPPMQPPLLLPAASPLLAPVPCEAAAQPAPPACPPVPALPPLAAPRPPSPPIAPPAPPAPAAVGACAMAAAAPIIPRTTGGKSAPSLASLLPPPLPHPASSSPPVKASQGGRQAAGKASAGHAWEEGQGHSEGDEREGSRGGGAVGGLAQQLLQLTGAPPPLAHGGKGRGGRYRGKKDKIRATAPTAPTSSQAAPAAAPMAPMALQQQLSQLHASQQQQGHSSEQYEQRYEQRYEHEVQAEAAQPPCYQHQSQQQQQQQQWEQDGVGGAFDEQPMPPGVPPPRTSLASLLPPLPSPSCAPPTPRTRATASTGGKPRGPGAASLPFKSRLAHLEAAQRQQQQQQQRGAQAGSGHEGAHGAQAVLHARADAGEVHAPWDGMRNLHVTVTSVSFEGHVAVCLCQQNQQRATSAAPLSQPGFHAGNGIAWEEGGGSRRSHLGGTADAGDAGGAASGGGAGEATGSWRERWRAGDASAGGADDASPHKHAQPFLAVIPTSSTTLNSSAPFAATATGAAATFPAPSASLVPAIQPGTAITIHPPWYHLPLVLPPPWGHTHAVFATHATNTAHAAPVGCTRGAEVPLVELAGGGGATADKGMQVDVGGGLAAAWGNMGC